ncbi:MAG: ABC-F family ATP-binding cassette domain-containing protein, partial [Alphaproteobacteria bacterium]
PEKIAELGKKIDFYNDELADPDFYRRDTSGFHDMTKDLVETQAKIERYETRWLELSAMKEEKEA